MINHLLDKGETLQVIDKNASIWDPALIEHVGKTLLILAQIWPRHLFQLRGS